MSKGPVPEPRLPAKTSVRLSVKLGPWVAAATAVSLLARLSSAADPPAPSAAPSAAPAVAPSAAPSSAATAAPAAAPTDDAPPSEAQKAEAKLHFEKGLSLLQEQSWAPALAEFIRSREIFPTRSATRNAAVAMRKLQRYDESLAMFETLLRDFPGMPAGERESAQKQATELRELVGTIDIAGAESGAAMVISGTDRGEYPPVVPLRVSAGSHVVRLVKEGFEPFETRVDVAGGQSVPVVAKMKKLADSGRLKVTERGGRTLDVLLDGGLVGRTPWEGLLGVGPHTVLLRSSSKLGTQPASVIVKSQQVSTLSLTAEDLESSLRVEPTPIGATVAIDSVTVGSGVWIGRLKTGPHKVEITAEGFTPAVREVKLEKAGRETVKVSLERDENAPFWRKPPKIALEVSAGLPLLPSFGLCTAACSEGVGLGALGFGHGTYELGSGLGFGVSLGYLLGSQGVTDRKTQLVPYNRNGDPPPQDGAAVDSLQLSAFMGGLHLSYHFGEGFPVLLRAGAGVLVGQVRDERKGRFVSGDTEYESGLVLDRQTAIYGYVDLEPKVGIRLGKSMDLSAGVQVLLLIGISQPKWTQTIEADAGPDGRGTYRGEPIMGPFLVGFAPTVSYRYEF